MLDKSDIARIEEARSQITKTLEKYKITKFEAVALLEQLKAELVWHSYIKQSGGVKLHE